MTSLFIKKSWFLQTKDTSPNSFGALKDTFISSRFSFSTTADHLMARSSFSLEISSKALVYFFLITILCKQPTSSSTEKKTSDSLLSEMSPVRPFFAKGFNFSRITYLAHELKDFIFNLKSRTLI